MSALTTQEGGNHYTKLAIQPMEYSMANKLDACQHTAIKYITRFRDKNGKQDLLKAIHVLQMLIEFEYGKDELQQITDMSQELKDYRTGEAWPVEQHGFPTNIVHGGGFIPWDVISSDIQYASKDEDGCIFGYSHTPEIYEKFKKWGVKAIPGVKFLELTGFGAVIPGPWKQSLRKRPK